MCLSMLPLSPRCLSVRWAGGHSPPAALSSLIGGPAEEGVFVLSGLQAGGGAPLVVSRRGNLLQQLPMSSQLLGQRVAREAHVDDLLRSYPLGQGKQPVTVLLGD